MSEPIRYFVAMCPHCGGLFDTGMLVDHEHDFHTISKLAVRRSPKVFEILCVSKGDYAI